LSEGHHPFQPLKKERNRKKTTINYTLHQWHPIEVMIEHQEFHNEVVVVPNAYGSTQKPKDVNINHMNILLVQYRLEIVYEYFVVHMIVDHYLIQQNKPEIDWLLRILLDHENVLIVRYFDRLLKMDKIDRQSIFELV
jgi:hypothetical protein